MEVHDSFPQFKDFVLEIRRLIWKACLPRRIAEEDFPYTLLDGKDSRQACWPNRTTYQNARVPILASVCIEARDVVFEWGMHKLSQDKTSLASIWVQPKIDRALHLNWTRRRNKAFFMINDAYVPPFEDTPLEMFIYYARDDYGMRISLVGELFCTFDLKRLMDSQPLFDVDSVGIATPSMSLDEDFENGQAHDLQNIIDMLGASEGTEHTVYATVVAISLHVDKAAALASGLFGLQGDAPVQTVDYDDVRQLRRFYDLFSSDTALKKAEPHVESMFNMILSPAFHAAATSWRNNVKWLFQVVVWKYLQKGEDIKTFGSTDPRSVWTPPVPKEHSSLRMDQFRPNEAHPWWAEYADKYVPKVVPQVMIRLCDNQCYKEGARPESFGEVGEGDMAVHGVKIDERGWMVFDE